MFVVEPTPHEEKHWTSKWVIDHGRDVYLQSIHGIGRQLGKTFILVHGDKTIPFETTWHTDTDFRDPATGDPYFVMRFSLFGVSATARQFGFEGYEFADEAEKKYWMRIAAEALAVYGLGYNGLDLRDGYTRVELDGELLTLSSFGYTSHNQV